MLVTGRETETRLLSPLLGMGAFYTYNAVHGVLMNWSYNWSTQTYHQNDGSPYLNMLCSPDYFNLDELLTRRA